MINATEAAIAVQLLSDMLVEVDARLPPVVVEEFAAACSALGVAADTSERLRVLV
jgi:hypothetical protein